MQNHPSDQEPRRVLGSFFAPKSQNTPTWEQRKLTNLCEKFTDGDWIEAKDQSDSGVRLVQTGNVGVTEYLDKPNNKKWISFETFEQLHCEEVYPGDILISRLPEPAGRACIMPNLGTKMITAVDCTIVRPNAVTSTRFLLQYLSSQAYFDAVNTCLAGGTRQRISRGNLAQFNVPIPSSKIEQEKIGEILEKLDTLITLHHRSEHANVPRPYQGGIQQTVYRVDYHLDDVNVLPLIEPADVIGFCRLAVEASQIQIGSREFHLRCLFLLLSSQLVETCRRTAETTISFSGAILSPGRSPR